MALLKPETRRRLLESDPRWQKKLTIRIVASVFAFLSIIMFSAVIPKFNAAFHRVDEVNSGDWTDGIVLGPLVFSLIYNILSITYLLTHTRPLPILLTVILDGLVSLAYIPAIVIAVIGGIFWLWPYATSIPDEDGNVDCSEYWNMYSSQCYPIYDIVGGLQVTGILFAFIAMCLTFTTFVWACKDHSRQRKERRLRRQQGTELDTPRLRHPVPPPAYEENVTTVRHDGATKWV